MKYQKTILINELYSNDTNYYFSNIFINNYTLNLILFTY